MTAAIETRGLGKRYRLGTDAAGYDTLRDAIRRTVTGGRSEEQVVWALRDLDLDVATGEVLGIVGRNGAGKTTLLRVLAGITDPSAGEARTRGRVGALLEVGTGFHPELTGRENVFLSGAILGMRRDEVRRSFDEIVEFAGIERFMGTPVKRYSAGMRLRLAFAVAAHIRPPILMVDEVLAVGDAAFRERCLGKMSEIGSTGRTVLFVSHDLGSITRFCPRAVWLESGRMREEGPSEEIVARYLDTGAGRPIVAEFAAGAESPLALERVWIEHAPGQVLTRITRGAPFTVAFRFRLRERHPALDASVWVTNREGVRIMDDARSDWTDESLSGETGTYEARVTLPGILVPGRYVVGLWIGSEYDELMDGEVLTIEVEPRPEDRQHVIGRRRLVQPEVRWGVSHEPEC